MVSVCHEPSYIQKKNQTLSCQVYMSAPFFSNTLSPNELGSRLCLPIPLSNTTIGLQQKFFLPDNPKVEYFIPLPSFLNF